MPKQHTYLDKFPTGIGQLLLLVSELINATATDLGEKVVREKEYLSAMIYRPQMNVVDVARLCAKG